MFSGKVNIKVKWVLINKIKSINGYLKNSIKCSEFRYEIIHLLFHFKMKNQYQQINFKYNKEDL